MHLRQNVALDAAGLIRPLAAYRQFPLRQQNRRRHAGEALICQRRNVFQSLEARGRCAARRKFALQAVEHRLDQCVNAAQVEPPLSRRQCDDEETRELAERAAEPESEARFGAVLSFHQAVDLAVAQGRFAQQQGKRVLHPG